MYDVDAVFCITLHESTERQKLMGELAQRLNLPITMYKVNRMANPLEGSWTSHYNLVKFSYENGYDKVLIFEDDAVESQLYSDDIIRDSFKFMNENKDWDLFYLGWCPGHPVDDANHFYSCLNGDKVKGYKHVYSCDCFCQHAYVVSRKGMKLFIEYFKQFNGQQMDIAVLTKKLNIYMCSPMLFDQRWCIQNSKANNEKQECKLSRWVNISTVSSLSLLYFKIAVIIYMIMVVILIISIYFYSKR
jgi:GR25 family glycosyltransferase involved in LPS biosynthesis